jgi:tetratricopeptide (TPR) repeat protein
VPRSRWQQWSRTAFALAALFASFPIVGRIVLGEWAFPGAGGIAGLWLAAGSYLHVRSRRMKTAPDPAAMLDEAIRLASIGDTPRAGPLLDRAIRENPWFWQAYQCRGEIRFTLGDTAGAAADLDEALRLAPGEPHLRELREQVEVSRRKPESPDYNP